MNFEKICSKLSSITSNSYETAEIINQYKAKHNTKLPIENYEREIMYILSTKRILIVIGETGCGKTTKIPEMISTNFPQYKIAHILPRKIACVSIASQVAKNMSLSLGKEVGYSIRFDYNYNNDTKIKFLTEGMFIRELMVWPLCDNYNVIIIDDCHEKSMNTELIFALLKCILKKRNDLKIIISSATIDYENYLSFFEEEEVELLYIKGRNYPIDIYYLSEPCENYIKCAFETVLMIHKNNSIITGDILVFLPGIEEIQMMYSYFIERNSPNTSNLLIYQLHASMPTMKTLEIFKPTPHNKRKVILSTNIAEASITIEGVSFVVDTCYTKMKFYNYETDTDHMLIIPASQSSLNQRSGRAGRTRPGQCYRLITEREFKFLDTVTPPEIQRNNMRDFIIALKSFGISNINKMSFISKINECILAKALENLYLIGIIDKETNLTENLGKIISDFPLDCRYSTSLIYSGINKQFNCTSEVLAIVSMLSVNNLFNQRISPEHILKAKQSKGMIEGDHLTLLSIFKIYKSIKNKSGKENFCKEMYINSAVMKEVEKLNDNIKQYLEKYKININRSMDMDGDDIIKSFMKGFILNIAVKTSDDSYRLIREEKSNVKLFIHPTSVLFTVLPEYIVFDDILVTKQCYMRNVSRVKKEWIEEVGKGFYVDKAKEIIENKMNKEINSHKTNTDKVLSFGTKEEKKKLKIFDGDEPIKDISKGNDENLSQFFEKAEDKSEPTKGNNKNIEKESKANLIEAQEAQEVDELEKIAMLRRKRNKAKKGKV